MIIVTILVCEMVTQVRFQIVHQDPPQQACVTEPLSANPGVQVLGAERRAPITRVTTRGDGTQRKATQGTPGKSRSRSQSFVSDMLDAAPFPRTRPAVTRSRPASSPQRDTCTADHFQTTISEKWKQKMKFPSEAELRKDECTPSRPQSFVLFQFPDTVSFNRSVPECQKHGVKVLDLSSGVRLRTREVIEDVPPSRWKLFEGESMRLQGTCWFRCGPLVDVRFPFPPSLQSPPARKKTPGEAPHIMIAAMDSLSRPSLYRSFPETLRAVARANRHPERDSWLQFPVRVDSVGSVGAFAEDVPAPEDQLYSVFDFRMVSTVGRGTTENMGPLFMGHHVLKRPNPSAESAIEREFGVPPLAQHPKLRTIDQTHCLFDVLREKLDYEYVTTSPSFGHDGLQCAWRDPLIGHFTSAVRDATTDSFGSYHVDMKGGARNFCYGSEMLTRYTLSSMAQMGAAIRAGKVSRPSFSAVRGSEAHCTNYRVPFWLDKPISEFVKNMLGRGAPARDRQQRQYAWTPVPEEPPTSLDEMDRLPIVAVMSDHGIMYGEWLLSSSAGMLETQTPFILLAVPNALLQRRPEVYRALRTNQDRLVTTFDLRATLLDMTTAFSKHGLRTDVEQPPVPYGESLLFPLPENRTCWDAGIPLSQCVCRPWNPVEPAQHSSFGREFVQLLNARASGSTKCAKYELAEVISLRTRADKSYAWIGNRPQAKSGMATAYSIVVETKPGPGFFAEKFDGLLSVDHGTYSLVKVRRLTNYDIYDTCHGMDSMEPLRNVCSCSLPWLKGTTPERNAERYVPPEYRMAKWATEV